MLGASVGAPELVGAEVDVGLSDGADDLDGALDMVGDVEGVEEGGYDGMSDGDTLCVKEDKQKFGMRKV